MSETVTDTRVPGLRYLTYWVSPQHSQGAVITDQVPDHVAEALTRRPWHRRRVLVSPMTDQVWAVPFLACIAVFVVLVVALSPLELPLLAVLMTAVVGAGATYWVVDLYGQRRSARQWSEYRNLLEQYQREFLDTDDPVAEAAMRVLDAEREAREAVHGIPDLAAKIPDVVPPIGDAVRHRMAAIAEDPTDAATLQRWEEVLSGSSRDDDDEALRAVRDQAEDARERQDHRAGAHQEMMDTLDGLRARLEQLTASAEARRSM